MSEKKMSFLPEDYVERRIEQRTNLVCLVLFGVVLVGVVGMYVASAQHRADVRREREKVIVAYADAAKRIEQWDSLQEQRSQMQRKANVTAKLLEKVPRSHLLADLGNRRPQGLSWLELEVQTKVVKPTAPPSGKSALANKEKEKKDAKGKPAEAPEPVKTVTLVLVGVAPTDVQVAQYMSKLQQSSLLSEVNLIYSEETKIAETLMRKFRIEMALSSTADVRALEPFEQPAKPRDPLENQALEPQVPDPGTLRTEAKP